MRITIKAVTDSPAFPDQVDVVVIGGGTIDTAVTYELAKQGIAVALFEKGAIGDEQSGRN
nr:FAD dependent oxidoreductase [Candidatus Pantoea persica]